MVDIIPPALLIGIAANDRGWNPAFTDAVGWSAGVVHGIQIGLIIGAVLSIITTLFDSIGRMIRR